MLLLQNDFDKGRTFRRLRSWTSKVDHSIHHLSEVIADRRQIIAGSRSVALRRFSRAQPFRRMDIPGQRTNRSDTANMVTE